MCLLHTSILSPHPLPPSVPSLVDVYVLLLLRIKASGGEYLSPVLVSHRAIENGKRANPQRQARG